MPPVFLVHTTADRSVPLENSLLFYDALRKANVPVEMHVYERGEHGFGVRADLGPTSAWVERWFEWMRARGWLPPAGGDARRTTAAAVDAEPRGRAASKASARPTSATARSSIRFSPAIIPTRRFSRTATTTT